MITNIEKIENLLKIGNYLKMHRINFNNMRLYIQTDPFEYYSGLTGALGSSTFKGDPDNKRLNKWRESMIDSFGEKNTDDYVGMTSDFGTLLHQALLTIKEKGGLNWKEEQEKAEHYFIGAFKEKQIEPDMRIIGQMCYEYNKHAASLMQFIYDRVNEIYAVETIACLPYLHIATPLDLVCNCRPTPKADFKKTTINLKTSSQIGKHQLEQCACELLMWNTTYESEPCSHTAILRSKDWSEKASPTYEFKYLEYEEAEKLAVRAFKRMELCLLEEASYFPNPVQKYFIGETKLGEMPKIVSKTIQEEWSEKLEELNNIELVTANFQPIPDMDLKTPEQKIDINQQTLF